MHRQTSLAGIALLLHLSFFHAIGVAELYCEQPVFQAGQVPTACR